MHFIGVNAHMTPLSNLKIDPFGTLLKVSIYDTVPIVRFGFFVILFYF